MSPDEQQVVEELGKKLIFLSFLLEQKDWIIMALLTRCSGKVIITNTEMDFVRKTYSMDESINSKSQALEDIQLKLTLKT